MNIFIPSSMYSVLMFSYAKFNTKKYSTIIIAFNIFKYISFKYFSFTSFTFLLLSLRSSSSKKFFKFFACQIFFVHYKFSSSYMMMLKTFKATVSVLNILFPNVIIFAPFVFNVSTSCSSKPPSGPYHNSYFYFIVIFFYV